MRISDWSSDVCSSDLLGDHRARRRGECRRLQERVLRDHRLVTAGVDIAAYRLVDLDRLEHADAAPEAAVTALVAALGRPDDGADIEPEHRGNAVEIGRAHV